MANRGSFFSVVATFNFSCLLAPCHDTAQVDERCLYHGNYSCTSAAHSFDVAACLGTYSILLMRYEQHEDYEKSPRGLVSCPHGENVDIAWPLVQDFALVSSHLSLVQTEHVAKGDPLGSAPHRWHRGALRPPELHRRPFAGDICVQILDAGL